MQLGVFAGYSAGVIVVVLVAAQAAAVVAISRRQVAEARVMLCHVGVESQACPGPHEVAA